jgi:hypothetical protein
MAAFPGHPTALRLLFEIIRAIINNSHDTETLQNWLLATKINSGHYDVCMEKIYTVVKLGPANIAPQEHRNVAFNDSQLVIKKLIHPRRFVNGHHVESFSGPILLGVLDDAE